MDSTSHNKAELLHHTAKVLAVTISMALLSLIFLDENLANYFNQNSLYAIRNFCRRVTDVGLAWPYFSIAGFAFLATTFRLPPFSKPDKPKLKSIRKAAGFSLIALSLMGASIHLLKFSFGRQRPYVAQPFDAFYFDPFSFHWHWHSLPSGHSQVVFVVATLIAIRWPRTRILALLGATLIAFTRVPTHQHFLSDTIIGGTIGYLGTLWIYHWTSTSTWWKTNILQRL